MALATHLSNAEIGATRVEGCTRDLTCGVPLGTIIQYAPSIFAEKLFEAGNVVLAAGQPVRGLLWYTPGLS